MENIIHKTQKGESEFGLTNTNKLIRQYEYATGLKTGSTSKAKFCVSATGRKDDIDLIAVIMAADDSKARVRDAITLLNYGFGKCQKYTEKKQKKISPVEVRGGTRKRGEGTPARCIHLYRHHRCRFDQDRRIKPEKIRM